MKPKKVWKMVLNLLIVVSVLSILYFYFKADSINPSKHEITMEEVSLFADYHLKMVQSQLLLLIVLAVSYVVNRKL